MARYVDPEKIFDPDAKPLTDEEVEMQMVDSFRTGRQFIKTMADPETENPLAAYVKSLPLCDDCKGHFEEVKQNTRPPCGVCFHLFKKPVTLTDEKGEEHPHYGWVKL